MVIGLALGLVLRESTDSIIYHFVVSMGTLFIRLLKMIIVPLIFSSIVVGVSSLGSGRALGRIGAKTFAYYFLTSLLAILIGLTLIKTVTT